jgi:hypothetical protein
MMTGNKARNKIRGMRAFIIREPLGTDGMRRALSVAWGERPGLEQRHSSVFFSYGDWCSYKKFGEFWTPRIMKAG